ncbi:hypothetical protein GPEL0_01r0067 [Geoanaerobacter pelophilus]|uniref:Uncharacterized protein n=1 Tax=Geoanaerobacter pelophilus TaxID=60036 RepID=A0ABQ0MDT7_9BACT|nr:hypothetical protein GPEL0_01r0067 [Geoanaerobacter pelophilus]
MTGHALPRSGAEPSAVCHPFLLSLGNYFFQTGPATAGSTKIPTVLRFFNNCKYSDPPVYVKTLRV